MKKWVLFLVLSFTGNCLAQDTVSDKFKTCLANVYDSEVAFRNLTGSFSNVTADLGLSKVAACKGLEITCQFASGQEFQVQARLKDLVWTVDHTKTISQIQ